MPSAVAVAAFGIAVLPYASPDRLSLTSPNTNPTEVVLVYILSVMMLSVVFAYASFPLYRFLEGYTMPAPLRHWLLRRRYREWYKVRGPLERYLDGDDSQDFDPEAAQRYPADREDLLPTKLGSTLRAMERYGYHTFGLDVLTFWNELRGVAHDNLRRDGEDARAGVDFFISAIAHLALLAIASATVAAASRSVVPGLVALVALGLMPLAYGQAVRNVDDWRAATQALVHLSRVPLANSLGLRMPRTFAEEREMWEAFMGVVQYGPGPDGFTLRQLDRRRIR